MERRKPILIQLSFREIMTIGPTGFNNREDPNIPADTWSNVGRSDQPKRNLVRPHVTETFIK